MSNVTIVGLCRNPTELAILNLYEHLYPNCTCKFVSVGNRSFIEDARELKLPYALQAPDIDEQLWQLIHAVDTRYVITIDCKMFGLLDLDLIQRTINTQHILFGTPMYKSELYTQSNLIHLGDYFVAFDKHTSNYQFFDWIRDIGRNWGTVSVAACKDELRVKRLETELAIAAQLANVNQRGQFCVNNFVQNGITVLNGIVLYHGQQLHPSSLEYVKEGSLCS